MYCTSTCSMFGENIKVFSFSSKFCKDLMSSASYTMHANIPMHPATRIEQKEDPKSKIERWKCQTNASNQPKKHPFLINKIKSHREQNKQCKERQWRSLLHYWWYQSYSCCLYNHRQYRRKVRRRRVLIYVPILSNHLKLYLDGEEEREQLLLLPSIR